MDPIRELLARLADESNPLSDDELTELQSLIAEAANDDSLTIEELTELADGAEAARAEQTARAEADAAEQAERDALRARIAPVEETDSDTPADDDTEDDDPADDDSDDSTDDTDAETDTAAEDAQPEPVAAAAPPAPAARPRVPAHMRPRPRPNRGEIVITAAGDVPGFSAGSRYPSVDAVGVALAAKLEAVAKSGSMPRTNVATFAEPALPADRTLHGNDSHGNAAKMEAVTAALMNQPLDAYEALVAAGGLCAPVPGAYDLVNVSTAARPLRDSLARFNADRGGIRFVAPPELADLDGAIGLWTEEQDTTPGAATKPCLTITCGSDTEVVVDAVTLCLQVGNFSRRTFPEQFAAWFALARAAHARRAENRLWDRMEILSTAVTSGSDVLGAARDILVHAARAASGLRSRHRMADDATIEIWLPAWVQDLMVADFTRQLPGDNAISVARGEIAGYFRDRNIMAHFVLDAGLDQVFGAEAGGALQNWPTSVQAIVSHPGAFTFLDGGTLDLGTDIRDSTLIGTNDVRAFLEAFENVAFRGVEALALTLNVCPSGETAATADTSAVCTTGS